MVSDMNTYSVLLHPEQQQLSPDSFWSGFHSDCTQNPDEDTTLHIQRAHIYHIFHK